MQSIYHNVQQNSDEWFDLRLGKITSSNFGKIMANFGKAFGNPAIEYARKLAHERVTGERDENGFTNYYMDRGHEYEPIAVELYQYDTFYKVDNGGFFDCGNVGGSPDGLVGVNGCIEIKTAIEKIHWSRIEKETPDTSYKWQVQGHLLVSNRKWCDFISFCPEFYEPKRLKIWRVERDEEMIGQLKLRIKEFEELIQMKIKILKS